MIVALAAGAVGVDDLDTLGKAATAFLVTALREQAAIVDARAALADRRRAARAIGPMDGLAALTADGAELDDRQRLLDDQRRLDTMQRDAVVYFRQQYITQCNGRDR